MHVIKNQWKNIKHFRHNKIHDNIKPNFERLTLIRELGRGSSSIVYKLYDKQFHNTYTCKTIDNNKKPCALREIKILRKLKKIDGFPQLSTIVEKENDISILTKYIPGIELYHWTADYIKYYTYLDEILMKDIFRKMVVATKTLHDKKFVHLDIKLENFLLSYNKKDNIVIHMIDFGSAHQNKKKTVTLSDIVGTSGYAPYEVYDGYYHPNSDVWSLGVCLWIFATGNFPFKNTNKRFRQSKDLFKFPTFGHLNYQMKMSPNLFNLFLHIFKNKPEDRISVDEILSSKWLNS